MGDGFADLLRAVEAAFDAGRPDGMGLADRLVSLAATPAELAEARFRRALFLVDLGRTRAAFEEASAAGEEAVRAGRDDLLARCASLGALLATTEGDHVEAGEMMALALAALADPGLDPVVRSSASNNLGGACTMLGSLRAASRFYREAIDASRAAGRTQEARWVTMNLASSLLELAQLLDDPTERAEAIEEAALLARQVSADEGADGAGDTARILLAEVDVLAGDLDRAAGRLAALGDHLSPRLVRARDEIQARLDIAAGRTDRALPVLDRLVRALDEDDDQVRLAHALELRAKALAAGHRLADALADVRAASRIEVERRRNLAERLVLELERRAEAEAEWRRVDGRMFELQRFATVDPLTGLGNRRALRSLLDRLDECQISVLLTDIDRFKQINDRFGHAAGDAVLVRLADILRGLAGQDVLTVRFGGEEFLAVLPSAPVEDAVALADAVRAEVSRQDWGSIVPGLRAVGLSAGIGSGASSAFSRALARADRALYRAKHAGGGRAVVDQGDDRGAGGLRLLRR